MKLEKQCILQTVKKKVGTGYDYQNATHTFFRTRHQYKDKKCHLKIVNIYHNFILFSTTIYYEFIQLNVRSFNGWRRMY